ncbi:MAG: KamA family radical SAM protein [Bacteriovoracaceae bacterium]|nr:KamA family radical SAM protein [Bacteriovoracaceae bacterium]
MNYEDLKTVEDLDGLYPKHILDKFPSAGQNAFDDVSKDEWNSWNWQLQNRVVDLDALESIINCSADEKKSFIESTEKFNMGITPYYANLMDKLDVTCPIRMQAVPNLGELIILKTDLEDPLGEEKDMPVLGLTHRYPDRVLFYVSNNCPMLCRHCTRKRKVAAPSSAAQNKQIEDGLKYIKEHKEVRDVIVSGGDPLVLSNDKIDYILGELRKIPHVEIVRLGTRTPVTLPQRMLDDKLIEILKKHGPIHLNTHFNHPKEMTREALLACTRLALAGVALGNQSVLLKGLNDDAKIMTSVCHRLLLMRVRPYYIYQCDLAEGISHFRTKITKGIEIIEKMRGWTSGLAIPQFVVDAPGGGGKIPVNPEYIVSRVENKVTLRNYKQEQYEYFEPS